MYIADFSFKEGEESKWYGLVYHMEYNPRSCRHYASYVKLICFNDAGWDKSTECRKFLKERGYWARVDNQAHSKTVVKVMRLSELRPYLEGKIEISYGPSAISMRLGTVENYQIKSYVGL